MAGVMVFSSRLFGIKRVNIFKRRRRLLQALVVDDQVAVIADLNLFASHGDHALDIKLVLRHRGQTRERAANARSLEDEDFSAFGSPEIVSQSINEKMVPITDLQLDEIVPFAVHVFRFDTGIIAQKGLLWTDAGSPGR